MKTITNFILDIAISVLRGLNWLLVQPIKLHDERKSRATLNKKLNNLTDPTFLERALKEKK
jgi:hypothetical protein